MPLVGQRMFLAVFLLAATMAISIKTVRAETAPPQPKVLLASNEASGSELTLPVKDNGMKLGDVIVSAGADGSIKIRRQSLLTAIHDVFRPDAMRNFETALTTGEYVDVTAVNEAGLVARYNANDLELQIEPKVEQRPRGEIDGTVRSNVESSNVVRPATVSGFVNTRVGIDYERIDGAQGTYDYPAIKLDGAGRWGGIVIEGEALLQIDGTFARQSTRVVYDVPDKALRVTGGDLDLRPIGSFSVPALLGVSIEKSYADLQPTKNVRPTGKRSFRLDRPSEVQVMVNGSEARRLKLQPGEYDLNDLPLASGTNDVQLRIKDDFGKEETIDFSILFNRTLLNSGVTEWSFAGGVRANAGLLSPWYDEEAAILTGTYRRGLSENVTGSVSAQASQDVALTGFNILSQTPYGLASVDAKVSGTVDGTVGWSGSAELAIETERLITSLNSAQLGVEIFSKNFVPSLDQASNEGSRVRVSGSVGRRLPAGMSASVAGYYQFADEETDGGFGTSFSLNKSVSQELTLGVSGNYDYRPDDSTGQMSGLSLFARLNYRPTTASYATLQFDHASNTMTAAGGSNFEQGASRASVNVQWEHTPQTEKDNAETVANADLYYADGRIEVNASHGRNFDQLASGTTSRRTTANAGIGFAFADDHIAFGRPVRGGYAIVDVHRSLDESTIRMAPFQDAYKAGSDGLGPILFSDISAYSRTSIPYDADNLPVGYDIGSGAFEFFAPYKAGFNVLIGSDFAVTAVGTLLDGDGKPLPLQAGTASASAYPDKHIVVFTNADGGFTVPGLKAGEWNIAMNGAPAKHYILNIRDDAGAYIDLGNLHPQS